MRRLPGPADYRLCERVQTLEALLVLFRDWQRTPTQSSVRTLRSLRPQMDVRFCKVQEPPAERHCCVTEGSDQPHCALSRARPETSCFLLTTDLHGCRSYGRNPAANFSLLNQGRLKGDGYPSTLLFYIDSREPVRTAVILPILNSLLN